MMLQSGASEAAARLSMSTLEQGRRELGVESVRYAFLLHSIGQAWLEAERPEAAVQFLQEAVERAQAVLGESHLGLATCYVSLGQATGEAAWVEQAIHLYRSVQPTDREALADAEKLATFLKLRKRL